jgi:HEPN domain-containing protein
VLKGIIYDLDALLERLSDKESARFKSIDLTWLTEWSIESRYPGDWPEASAVVYFGEDDV